MAEFVRKARSVAAVVAFSAVIASCGWGVTKPPQSVTNTGAQLTGDVHNTITGATEYWYEYGPTLAYGASTPHRSLDVSDPAAAYPVTAAVGALAEGTLYHARLCARASTGYGICGGDQRFTTAGERDTVTGTGTVFSIPGLGYAIAGSFTTSADPDGTDAVGDAATVPGFFYFRLEDSGPVSCLRVEGNRATIGFVSDPGRYGIPEAPVFVLAYVEDNGPSGDRFGRSILTNPTSCPAATDADFPNFMVGAYPVPPILTSGDFVVHDAPG